MWADAQADPRLRLAQRSLCWFCHEAAHFVQDTGEIRLKFTLYESRRSTRSCSSRNITVIVLETRFTTTGSTLSPLLVVLAAG